MLNETHFGKARASKKIVQILSELGPIGEKLQPKLVTLFMEYRIGFRELLYIKNWSIYAQLSLLWVENYFTRVDSLNVPKILETHVKNSLKGIFRDHLKKFQKINKS